MAKNIDKDTVTALKTKKYVYSWLEYGEGDTAISVSDKLSSAILNLGTANKATEITVKDGSTNAYAKVIAGSYTYAGAASGAVNVPSKLTVSGVDASAVYGGAFIASKEGASSANSKYGTKVTTTTVNAQGKKVKTTTTVTTDITVDGNVDLTIAAAKVTSVFGGGAGYGSVLNGDVKISLVGTNNIGTVYGGGQTGAVVNGDVEIVVGRTDARGYTETTSRIGAIYGGGYNAVVNGDVNITIDGANAVKIGTVSGSGKGSKAFVNGERTLTIANYTGKFTTTIKDFDNIILSSGTSITLTQSQNKTILGANYEFVVDTAALDQKDAILTWNKNINVSGFSVTIADDLMTSVSDSFQTTIYSSTYLTQAAFDAADIKIYDANGDLVTGNFTLTFVADTYISRGTTKNKTKGGSIVLTYDGGCHTVTGDADYIGSQANDEVKVDDGTVMTKEIYLGGGENILDVKKGAQVTGSIVVDKNSDNTIYVRGQIEKIRGGDETTNNTVYLDSADPLNTNTLTFEGASNDKVVVTKQFETTKTVEETEYVEYMDGNGDYQQVKKIVQKEVPTIKGIDFGKGADTIVFKKDGDSNFSVTFEDGEDAIVVYENGVTIDADNLKLTGTDNVFVVANGVSATIKSDTIGRFVSMFGSGEATSYDGIFLSQNAMVTVNNESVISSYNADINLQGNLTVIAVRTGDKVPARIAEYYVEGKGVEGTIVANGNDITLNAGATINSNVIGAGTIEFKGDAGGANLTFENEVGAPTTLKVAKGATATVGSIAGLVTEDAATTLSDVAQFELDAAQLTLGNNARVVEVINDRTIVGPITEAAEFSGNVAFIGKVTAEVTLKDAQAFFGETSAFNKKNIVFVGENKVDVNGDQTLNNKKLDLTNGTVQFNVLDDAKLVIDGLVKGAALPAYFEAVTLGTNSRFAYGDTLRTGSWNKTLDATALTGLDWATNITIDANATIEDKIDFSGNGIPRNIVINDGVEVTAIDEHNAETVITLGQDDDTLTIGAATIDGAIKATGNGNDTVILNGTTINVAYGKTDAVVLGDEDNLTANAAKIDGDVTGGAIVIENGTDVQGTVTGTATITDSTVQTVTGTSEITNSTITGAVAGVSIITDSTVGALSGTSTVYGATTIGTMEADATVTLDGATATINAIAGDNQNLTIKNGATVAGDAVVDGALQMTAADDATLAVSEAAAQSVVQNAGGKATVSLNGDVSSVGDITQNATTEAKVKAYDYVEQKYTTETEVEGKYTPEAEGKYPKALEPIGTDEAPITIQRTTGAVAQTSAENYFGGGAEIKADGTYATGYHKPAQVVVDKIAANYGTVDQSGNSNDVQLGFYFYAKGESDIKVQGASETKLGDVTQQSTFGTNEFSAEIEASEDAESKLFLGDKVTIDVGAINQTSYAKDDDKDDNFTNEVTLSTNKDNAFAAQESITAKSVEMKAYRGSNKLDVKGNVEVTGDITVGGVLEGETYEKYTWGDKAADYNKVEIDADTAKIDGKVGLIGLKNVLTLTNDSFYNGDKTEYTVGTTITLAGKDNAIDIDAGVKMDNITLADIVDYDKVGQDGQDLPDFSRSVSADYKNTITLRGKVAAIALDQQNSSDTINVYGGTIDGDVVTNNGNDTVNLGADRDTVLKGAVLGDSTIGGKVVMGTKGAANGTNTIMMGAFNVNGEGHGVAIGGSVEMYASSQHTMTDGGPFDNTLSLQGNEMGAKIGGSVTMVAETDENAIINELGTNALAMGYTTTIDGDVTMTAYSGNGIQVDASEEYHYNGAELKGYAEITGQVSMTADENTIMVGTNGNQAKLAGSNGAAAYMNGIEMHNTYVADGDTLLTGNEAENTITVGSADTNLGSELIVGKSVSELADVSMGDIVKTTADGSWTLSAVDVAERGHDVITYTPGDDTDVYSLTAKNAITVTGRFSAKDVKMLASENKITVTGNGDLQKDDVSTDEVRTALFQAASITQVGKGENLISAEGTAPIAHYGYVDVVDPQTGDVTMQYEKIDEIASVAFKSGAIKQEALNDGDANNTVTLTGTIVATTGDITQTGGGENVVTVEAFESEEFAPEDGAPHSLVGNIAQSTAEILADYNTVTLTRTDVGTADGALVNPGTIDQFAVNDNKVTMEESLSGAITQYGISDNLVKLTSSESGAITQTSVLDSNEVTLDKSVTGAITQTAEDTNTLTSNGSTSDWAVDYDSSEIQGAIIQNSALEHVSGHYAFTNTIETTATNIAGNIEQTGLDTNRIMVSGGLKAVNIELDEKSSYLNEQQTYKQAFDVKVAGDVKQKGANNASTFTDATVTGNIDQTADFANGVELSADVETAAAVIKDSADQACSFEDEKNHNVEGIVSNPETFNTQSVGNITQTVERPSVIDEGDVIGEFSNYVNATNYNMGDITQSHAYGANTIKVKAPEEALKKFAEYVGEINDDPKLTPVKKVAEYDARTTVQVGEIAQTSNENHVTLTGANAGTTTQTGVSSDDYASEFKYASNAFTATNGTDVTKTLLEKAAASWDAEKAAEDAEKHNGEVFEDIVIGENKRQDVTVGRITQTTDATGNYTGDDDDLVKNTINLTDVNVAGEQLFGGKVAISQKAVAAKDAGVVNTLSAETTAQDFADLATTEVKSKVNPDEVVIEIGTGVEYDLNTENTIDGSIEQSGFENIATLTGYDVNGNIDQFASKVSTYTDHGDVVSNQMVGINSLKIFGTYNWNDAGETPEDTYEAMGIERTKLTATVSGNVTQVIDDASAFETDSSNNFSAGLASITGTTYQEIDRGDNTVSVEGADFADITQKTVEGNNSVTAFSNTNELSGIDSSKIGKITQDGLVNSVTSGEDETAGDVATGAITQNANGTTFGSNMLQNTVKLDNTYGVITETEETDAATITREVRGKTAAESITQKVTAVADEEGFFADATTNPRAGEYNEVTLACADAGDITQSGNARTANRVTATGATPTTTTITNITDEQKAAKKAAEDLIAAKGEANGGEIEGLRTVMTLGNPNETTVEGKINAAIDIAKIRTSDEYVAAQATIAAYADIEPADARTTVTTDRPNTLGAIDQTGLTNDVTAQDYATAGDLTQTSRTYATKTDPAEGDDGVMTYTTQKDATDIDNKITLSDVLSAGNVKQTVNAEEFDVKTFKLDAETETYVEDVDAATTGTVNGDNTFTVNAAETKSTTVGNVTQEQVGKDGYAATGNNTTWAKGVNLGNVDQDALAGSNDLTVYTNTTDDDAYSTKLGTVNQDGKTNSVITGDVETKAIVQKANGLAAGYELGNSIDMTGVENLPSVTTIEGDKQVQREGLAAAKAESITQTINVFQNEDGSVDADETLRQNYILLSYADAGFVTQTGVAATWNYLSSTGATLTVQTAAYSEEYAQAKRDKNLFDAEIKELEIVRDQKVADADMQTVQDKIDEIQNSDAYKAAEKIVTSYETFVDAPNEYPNVIGPVTQIGTTNDASIYDESVATKEEDGTLTAADIVQTSSTYATTSKQQPDQDDPASTIYTTSKYDGALDNTILFNVATAGNVQQTVNAETFDVKTHKIDDATKETTDKSTVTGTANGNNTLTVTTANVANVTQTQVGVDGYAATGDNLIQATASNMGNVVQDAVKGNNTFQAAGTGAHNEASDKAVLKEDAADPLKAESYEFTQTELVEQSVGTIDQTINVPIFWDEGVFEVALADPTGMSEADAKKLILAKPDLLKNIVDLNYMSADAITQTGNFTTKNALTFAGASIQEVEVKIETELNEEGETVVKENGVSLVNKATKSYPNTIGAVTQTGVTNTADIKDGSFATATVGEGEAATEVVSGITQTANTFVMTYEDGDAQDAEGRYTSIISKAVYKNDNIETKTTLDNTATVANMAQVGDVLQTVNAVTYTTDARIGNELVNQEEVYVNGTNAFTATASNIGDVTQTGALLNTVTLGTAGVANDAATAGAVVQTAALAGAKGTLKNEFVVRAGGAIDSLTQTANGAYVTEPAEEEGEAAKVVTNTNGVNTAVIGWSDITGATVQTAAGEKAKNSLQATGGYTKSAMPKLEDPSANPSAENKYVLSNGTFDNSLGDVTQTLVGYGTTAEAVENAYNTITLTQMNAGAIAQSATYLFGEGEAQKTCAYTVENKLVATVADNVKNNVKQYKLTEDGLDYSEGAALRTTIASITQDGFKNTLDLAYVNVGAFETVGEGEEAEEVFTLGDINVKAYAYETVDGDVTTLFYGSNSVKLNNVDVNDLTVDTTLEKRGESYTMDAANATLVLTAVNVNDITTGAGTDKLTINGNSTVTGTIDLGDVTYTKTTEGEKIIFTPGEDWLKIDQELGAVDLSAATIKDAEVIETHGLSTLDVFGLVGSTVRFDTGVTKLNVTELELGKIGCYPDGSKGEQSGYTSKLETIRSQADKDDSAKYTTAVNYKFTAGLDKTSDTVTNVIGSTVAGDTVTLGDGVLGEDDVKDATFKNVTLTGFETVTIQKDAVLDGVTWKTQNDEGATNKITIDVLGTVTTAGINIGKLDGYTTFSGADQDFTLKIGGKVATYQSAALGVATFTLGSDTYKYTLSSGTLAKA